jgi:SAM-dependent methyltransferase
MSHVDYGEWLRLIQQVVERWLPSPAARVLEIGGGTGALGALLKRAGHHYTCSDRAFGMCRVAAGRALSPFVADGRALPLKAQYDLLLFLYDGINYLGSREDYDALFSEAGRVLTAGGLFLFDVTTEANSLAYFRDWLTFEDFAEACYVRHSYYNPKDRVQHNRFTIFTRSPRAEALWERSEEHHRQLVLAPATIRSYVPRALFEVVGMWDGFSQRRWSARSERVHFLLRRRPA